MNQQGYIVEIVDSVTAKLKLKRHFACASCGKCATTCEEKYIIVEYFYSDNGYYIRMDM